MDRYRKKPVVIEAIRFDGSDECAEYLCQWSGGEVSLNDGDAVVIETLEGPMFVSDGDYVIRGVQGEYYPCKPDIFEAAYEKVE